MIGFYGSPDSSKRTQSWILLSTIHTEANKPWCVIVDFNKIISQYEKWGGQMRPINQIEQFRNTLADNRQHNMGWEGYKYTWSNRHKDHTFTKERLHRIVSNLEWRDLMGNGQVEVLSFSQSDYKSLFLNTRETNMLQYRKRRRFRFEASWTKEHGSFQLLSDVWKKGSEGINC